MTIDSRTVYQTYNAPRRPLTTDTVAKATPTAGAALFDIDAIYRRLNANTGDLARRAAQKGRAP